MVYGGWYVLLVIKFSTMFKVFVHLFMITRAMSTIALTQVALTE